MLKKVIKRLAFFAVVELPLASFAAYVSVRTKQLCEKYTDEEIKTMLADKATSIHQGALLLAAARQRAAADKATSNGATETRSRADYARHYGGF